MPIRRSGRWMYPVDERILETLRDSSWETPKTMADYSEFKEIRADESYIRRRCEILVAHELIAPELEDQDMYEITDRGLAYLRGEAAADMLYPRLVG